MQLVVLAGGLGTRLRGSVPEGTPKPMGTVAGRPFLEHVLDIAVGQGANDIVSLIGHNASAISDHFGADYRGVRIQYSCATSPLGTGGAIRLAAPLLAGEFVLQNGDTYAEVDLIALLGHLKAGPLAMSLTPMHDPGRFGAVAVEGNVAVELIEKSGRGPGLINAGMYGCRRDLLAHFPQAGRFSLESDVLQPGLPLLRPRFELTRAVFFDIGVPEDYAAADRFFRARG